MTKKFYVQEWRTLDWVVEVPDAITKEDIENCGLQAEEFVGDWTDHGNTEHAYITVHEVPPEDCDDNEPDVVLNHLLKVVEDYAKSELHDGQEVEMRAMEAQFRLEDYSCKTLAVGTEEEVMAHLQERAPNGFYRVYGPEGLEHYVRQNGEVVYDFDTLTLEGMEGGYDPDAGSSASEEGRRNLAEN